MRPPKKPKPKKYVVETNSLGYTADKQNGIRAKVVEIVMEERKRILEAVDLEAQYVVEVEAARANGRKHFQRPLTEEERLARLKAINRRLQHKAAMRNSALRVLGEIRWRRISEQYKESVKEQAIQMEEELKEQERFAEKRRKRYEAAMLHTGHRFADGS
eukprot:GHVU01180822.1.p2 GENE.GHVU01180822.1~~GHVU01180822.1.p2  ORF type:complete len:172 (+),score=42.36 GHVU01180822.1:37-516(+)